MESIISAWELAIGLFADGFLSLVCAAAILPALGVLLAYRRLPFTAMAIPATAGAGAAFGYWVWPLLAGFTLDAPPTPPPPLLLVAGGLLILLLGIAFISGREERSGSAEPRAAILFLGATAAAELLLQASPYEEAASSWLRQGRVLSVLPEGRWRVILMTTLVSVLLLRHRRALLQTAVDRDLAVTAGLPERRWRFATLALVSLACLVTVPELGPHIVLALLLVPSILLVPRAVTFPRALLLTSLAGVSSAVCAFLTSVVLDRPVTPCLVLSTIAVSAALRPLAALDRAGAGRLVRPTL